MSRVPTTAEIVTASACDAPDPTFELLHLTDVVEIQIELSHNDVPRRTVGLESYMPKLTPANVTLTSEDDGMFGVDEYEITAESKEKKETAEPTTAEIVSETDASVVLLAAVFKQSNELRLFQDVVPQTCRDTTIVGETAALSKFRPTRVIDASPDMGEFVDEYDRAGASNERYDEYAPAIELIVAKSLKSLPLPYGTAQERVVADDHEVVSHVVLPILPVGV